jgi:RHS repeat-associated protein
MTQRWTKGNTVGLTSTAVNMYDQLQAAAGPTGTRSATGGVSAKWVAHSLALRPATSYSYDGNGNLTTTSDGSAFTYDAGDRTKTITAPSGAPVAITYQGAGQTEPTSVQPATRTSGSCPHVWTCPSTSTTLGSAATLENSILGVSAETVGTSTTYYVRDPSGGLLGERTPNGTYGYILDRRGSVLHLMDTAGNFVANYAYDPYGQLTGISGGTVAVNNPFRYVSAYQDGTGLYHMGARYYDPATGRFTQQDPHFNPLDPKQWNRYTYAGGDPINFSDLNGQKPEQVSCDRAMKAVTAFYGILHGSLFLGELIAELASGEGLIHAALAALLSPASAVAVEVTVILGVAVYIFKCLH